MTIKKSSSGTKYVCDIKTLTRQLSLINNEMLLSVTVNQRLSSFAGRDVVGIERALELQRSLAYPSRKEVSNSILNGTIINCTVTVRDLANAECVYGKPELNGKATKPNNSDHKAVDVNRSSD